MEILIIRPAALGDTLMLLPALDQIRGSDSVILVGRRPGIHYMGSFARLCLDFEGMGWHTIFTDIPEVPNLPHIDMAAAFLRDVDGKVKRNLQLLLPDAQVHVFPGLPEKAEGIHTALHLARCLRTAGCTEVDPEECIGKAIRVPLLSGDVVQGPEPAPDLIRRSNIQRSKVLPRPGTLDAGPGTPGSSPGQALTRERIIFHPGSGSPEKNHSPEFWLDLIETISNHANSRGLLPTLLFGPAEEGPWTFFGKKLRKIRHELLSSPGPEDLVCLLREGALFLGQDSGVTHLSAMLGLPTIALFRNSSVQMWRPLGPRVSVIEDKGDGVDVSAILKEAGSCLRRE